MAAGLRLGPMLRNVTETTATIWVETDAPCLVTVTAPGHRADAPTFAVHGHHYAICELSGMRPGAALPYEVQLDGVRVWPTSGAMPSFVRTLDTSEPVRLLFGSCRVTTDHSPETTKSYGVDMLRAQAQHLAEQRHANGPGATAGAAEPTFLLLIGDQVYADELQPPMREFLSESRAAAHAQKYPDAAVRREATEPPEDEVVFFDEYAELYRQAWTDPDIRWLFSTVPTLMLFDDHDIRDDWNTSGTWRREINQNRWWRSRITSGLGAYWVYQHLGNLTPEERLADPVFGKVLAADDSGADLDTFAARADEDPASYQWSHAHDLGGSRLVMVDTRCGRMVDDDRRRSMLDEDESAWLDTQLTGNLDHLVVASTLPYLLPAGVHHLEAWNEAMCAGKWGGVLRGPSEKLRQAVDLEHWSAFQRSFKAVADAVVRVASGQRGRAPASVLFLGGDVHFSYLARARPRENDASADTSGTTIAQLVSSPLRNKLPSILGKLLRVAASPAVGAMVSGVARLAGVRRPAVTWRMSEGPWYGNVLATLTLDGRHAEVTWDQADPPDTQHSAAESTSRPQLRELSRHRLAG